MVLDGWKSVSNPHERKVAVSDFCRSGGPDTAFGEITIPGRHRGAACFPRAEAASDFFRYSERGAVLVLQHVVGFVVADESPGVGIELDLALQPVGNIAEKAEGRGEIGFIDFGVEHLRLVCLHGIEEIAEVRDLPRGRWFAAEVCKYKIWRLPG
jgi:hypothetical protein